MGLNFNSGITVKEGGKLKKKKLDLRKNLKPHKFDEEQLTEGIRVGIVRRVCDW